MAVWIPQTAGLPGNAGRGRLSAMRVLRGVAFPLFIVAACVSAACSRQPGICDGMDCSGHGICFHIADAMYCECARGYHPAGFECVADSLSDPCAGVTCDEHGTCRVVGLIWVCDCDRGYYFDGGHCLPGDPCPDPLEW